MKKMDLTIRNMLPEDWPSVRSIYLQGICSGISTFETSVPEWEEWDKAHRKTCRFVAVSPENVVIGWAVLSQITKREAYHGVAEVSIYIHEKFRGQGVGKALLSMLIESSENEGIWTLQARIFAENEASIKLHLACGFHIVGRRERIARVNGSWHDTILLERRSSIVGVD
jgi:L-amino acid N-acyltransferase YncA